MHSDMIGKIEKARIYATEPERLQIRELAVIFRGENSTHLITLNDGIWHHDHEDDHQISPHIMALQRILAPMLPAAAKELVAEPGVPMYSDMIGKIEKARIYANEPERITIKRCGLIFAVATELTLLPSTQPSSGHAIANSFWHGAHASM